jgi:LysM repeat protein
MATPTKVTVKSGQTLSGIAKANNTTVTKILAANPTLAARQSAGQTVLFSGTKVTIPGTKTEEPIKGVQLPYIPPKTEEPTGGLTQEDINAAVAAALAGQSNQNAAQLAALQTQLAALLAGQNKAAEDAAAARVVAQAEAAKAKEQQRQSIIDVLSARFKQYGLETLTDTIKQLAVDGATESTVTLALQNTDAYKVRFKANEDRAKAGLTVLQPAEYLNLEDSYRQVLRAYGLKQFDNDAYVQQFIANDVSATELSNRVVTAVQRVQNADPAIQKQLRDYYGVGATDLVAYVLDPAQQFQKIERQVAASEIGVAAGKQGLTAGVQVAEQLAAQGVSAAEAQKGYATIANILPTAEKLSQIYGGTMDTYGQGQAEQEVFNQLASAQRARERLTAREVAQFGGTSGVGKTSLSSGSGQI